jgi:hypothetical protein
MTKLIGDILLAEPSAEENDKQKQSGTPVTDMTGDERTKTQT